MLGQAKPLPWTAPPPDTGQDDRMAVENRLSGHKEPFAKIMVDRA